VGCAFSDALKITHVHVNAGNVRFVACGLSSVEEVTMVQELGEALKLAARCWCCDCAGDEETCAECLRQDELVEAISGDSEEINYYEG